MKTLSVFLVLSILMVAACTVEPQTIIKGEELCSNNGGVDHYYIDVYDVTVFCKNTARFKYKTK